MRSLFIIAMVLSGCAPQRDHEFRIDPSLRPAYDLFMAAAQQRGWLRDGVDDLVIQFKPELGESSPGSEILGECVTGDGGTPTINIDSTDWATLGTCQKDMLIFHELGHCLLNRGHKDALGSDGYALSVMHSSLIPETACQLKKDYYIGELFSG